MKVVFSFNRSTAATRCQTPIQYAWDRHDRLSVIAALPYRPWSQRTLLYFTTQSRNVIAPEFREFACQLCKHLPSNQKILICDHYRVNRSAVRELLEKGAKWLKVEWLPYYAPAITPVEAVWNQAKYSDLPTFVTDDSNQLYDLATE